MDYDSNVLTNWTIPFYICLFLGFLHPLCDSNELFVIDKIVKKDCLKHFNTAFLCLSNPFKFRCIYLTFNWIKYSIIESKIETNVVNVTFLAPRVFLDPADVQNNTSPLRFVIVHKILLDVNKILSLIDLKLFWIIFNCLRIPYKNSSFSKDRFIFEFDLGSYI